MLSGTPGPERNRTEAAADDAWFARWRQQELDRVEAAGLCYLDYTGAALYAASLVEADAARLKSSILGNPHSEHRASLDATADLEHARQAILDFLNADPSEFEVVLTANASGACRLVGEGFPFGPGRGLVLTADNHNSVNGIREFARARGVQTVTIPLDASLRLSDAEAILRRERGAGGALFGFPAQSNFSGVRHRLSLVTLAQELGYRVLLDAAALLPTSSMDLHQVRPDFLALSLYKITGYPSGVGALVARRDALAELTRPWFAGGTVDWVTTAPARHRLRQGGAGFEDGTPPFLLLGAVPLALATVVAADRPRLARHLAVLTERLLQGMAGLHYPDGSPVVAIHGPADAADRGATVSFSVRGPDGAIQPFWEVECAARDAGIAIRGGCFCNPGCAERAFGLDHARVEPCLEQLGGAFTIPDFARCLEDYGVGALRISLGLGSVAADVDRALGFLDRYSAGLPADGAGEPGAVSTATAGAASPRRSARRS